MLWPGHGLYVGPLLPNAPHAHHAVQITAALTGRVTSHSADGIGGRAGAVVVVGRDEVHALTGSATTFQLYVDPGALPAHLDAGGSTAEAQRLTGRVRRLLPTLRLLWDEHAELEAWRRAAQRITVVGPPWGDDQQRVFDDRIARTLARVHASPGDPPGLTDAAAAVGLSAGRFGHLFSEGTGLPYRRYLLWARLIAAVADLSSAGSLTSAAHRAGFADQSHLTRTFRRMFGMPPSALVGHIAAVEIDLAGGVPTQAVSGASTAGG